ncbi:MAG TPA: TRAP transporter small permease [Tissierellales bacterium]|nr:TRAP transporter small permease [Tissierellales bacterium]
MNKFWENFKRDFELYIGSIFLAITSIVVIMNVFTRYFLKFTYHWAEEVAVAAFVWVIFLGLANAYKTDHLIGVEAIMKLLPKRGRRIVEFIVSIVVSILAGSMFYFSYKYVAGSTKITAALEISYSYINSSIVISFALITIYSVFFAVRSFKKIFLD